MCTLTYLPLDGGFTFTHNRDERQDRPTSEQFQVLERAGAKIYFPKDLEANGTWIAYSDSGRAIALLNGGKEIHKRKDSYRHSRGLVVLDNFNYTDQKDFYQNYNFEDIEPFTLIIRDDAGLWKITHSEDGTTIDQLDEATTGIWSSATLYSKEVRNRRKEWFHSWFKSEKNPNPESARQFHNNAGDGDGENDLIMSRLGILKTVSITQIHVEDNIALLSYEDLVKNSRDMRTVKR